MAQKYLQYKGKPLVRCDNTLYYGDMTDEFIVMLQILSTKPMEDMVMASKVMVSLMSTDPSIRLKDRIIKKTEKDGLYNALDVGSIWLSRALDEKKAAAK